MNDLALLHHWATVVGYSILNTSELDHFWHSTIPLIGFKYPYVIHSILSISALHMAYTNRPENRLFLITAARHRSKALDGFSADLHNVGSDNSSALFANATLTFLYAFISFSKTFDEERSTKDQTSRILGAEWIPLVRGTAAVLQPIRDCVQEGPLGPLLHLEKFDDPYPGEELHVNIFRDQLSKLPELWAGEGDADMYNETVQILRNCHAWMERFDNTRESLKASWGYNRFWSGPFIWIFSAPERYFVLQQQRQPHALIIFAYYGVLLNSLDGYWWAEGCGKSIVATVDECLGPYWSSWMDWPKQAVGIH